MHAYLSCLELLCFVDLRIPAFSPHEISLLLSLKTSSLDFSLFSPSGAALQDMLDPALYSLHPIPSHPSPLRSLCSR